MPTESIGRRKFLEAVTSLVAVTVAVGISMPFAQSWRPSARAKVAGAPIVVGVGNIESGKMITVKWRGKPVWVLRRTDLILPEEFSRMYRPRQIWLFHHTDT